MFVSVCQAPSFIGLWVLVILSGYYRGGSECDVTSFFPHPCKAALPCPCGLGDFKSITFLFIYGNKNALVASTLVVI